MISKDMARAMGDPNYSATESAYAWVISFDHLEHKGVRIYGPHNATDAQIDALSKGKGDKFRIYDDDGELYFSGRFLEEGKTWRDSDYSFGPLDDYGEPDSGATEIRYLNEEGKWETR